MVLPLGPSVRMRFPASSKEMRLEPPCCGPTLEGGSSSLVRALECSGRFLEALLQLAEASASCKVLEGEFVNASLPTAHAYHM